MRNGLGFYLFIVIGTLIIGCSAKKPTGTSTSSSDSSSQNPPATSNPGSTCSTSVLDYGQKGTVAAIARGSYSDVQMIPSSNQPATAFVDAGSLSIKLSYWDGSQFVTEVVSGDGAGIFVRLAFLSNGIPMVFWAQGANLKMAIRSATLTTSGSWTAGVIDTGVAPRAIEVAVNPLGQVGVVYISDTAATGRPKFLYCNSPCAGPASFQAMSATPYIENTNVIAATVATGISWCKVSDTSYYPAVSYAVTGATKYAVCRNSLGNCLTNTNWQTQSVVATALTSSKIILDPEVTGDIPKVMSLGAAGPIPYVMGTTACTAAPAAFTGGSAIGTATTANQWMKVLKDSTGKFHLVANESTTSVRYYNSQTTTFNGAWNTQGTIDTVTLAAAHGGGGAIDNTNQAIYTSYGISVAPYDLKLGRVQNFTVASSSATFVKYTPDTSGSLQLAAANSQLALNRMATTSTDLPAVAYTDYSVGAATSGKLKYAIREDTSKTGTWSSVLIPGTITPEFPDLKFDRNDHPWIGYFDAGNNRFYLATNSNTDGSGTWSQYEFPVTPSGAPGALPMANQVALGFKTVGSAQYPIMVILDNAVSGRGVKAAIFNPQTLSWSDINTVDSTITSGASHLSLDFDYYNSVNTIVIGYRDILANKAKFAAFDGTTWSTAITVGSSGHGAGLQIKINPVNLYPTMSYYDRAGNSVISASCSASVATCSSGGWSTSIIDSAAGVSGLATGNEQLLSTTQHFDSVGNKTVYFPSGQTGFGSLRSGTWNTTNLNFDLTTIRSGVNGNLSGLTAVNFGVAGWNVSSTESSTGQITMTYIGPGNWLYTTSCGQ